VIQPTHCSRKRNLRPPDDLGPSDGNRSRLVCHPPVAELAEEAVAPALDTSVCEQGAGMAPSSRDPNRCRDAADITRDGGTRVRPISELTKESVAPAHNRRAPESLAGAVLTGRDRDDSPDPLGRRRAVPCSCAKLPVAVGPPAVHRAGTEQCAGMRALRPRLAEQAGWPLAEERKTRSSIHCPGRYRRCHPSKRVRRRAALRTRARRRRRGSGSPQSP